MNFSKDISEVSESELTSHPFGSAAKADIVRFFTTELEEDRRAKALSGMVEYAKAHILRPSEHQKKLRPQLLCVSLAHDAVTCLHMHAVLLQQQVFRINLKTARRHLKTRRPANVEVVAGAAPDPALFEGATVKLVGLPGLAAKFNGSDGLVEGYSAEKAKYLVSGVTSKPLLFAAEHMQVRALHPHDPAQQSPLHLPSERRCDDNNDGNDGPRVIATNSMRIQFWASETRFYLHGLAPGAAVRLVGESAVLPPGCPPGTRESIECCTRQLQTSTFVVTALDHTYRGLLR
eukprot:SAG11_NODE_3039_length_2741_cov_2.441711_1_plen_290_part_00